MFTLRINLSGYLLVAVTAIAAYIWSGQAIGQDNDEQLRFGDKRQCVFADQEAGFRVIYEAEDSEPRPSQLQGFLHVKNRTAARAKTKLKPAEAGRMAATLKVSIPRVKPGVVMPAELEVMIPGEDNKETVRRKRKLYLFSPDPFSVRENWLENLNIRVFDPAENTVEAFENAEIPHDIVHNTSRIDGFTEGFLILGSGISLRKQRKLLPNVLTAAENGVIVLCLKPKEGRAILPGISGTRRVQPKRVTLEGKDVVKLFNKRFDILTGPSGQATKTKPLVIKAEDNDIRGSFTKKRKNERGWPWFLAEYQNDGRFLITTLPLINMWKNSPVPRYLLLEILKKYSAETTAQKNKENEPRRRKG